MLIVVIISYILLILSSNAVTLRRDMSILYSRSVMLILFYSLIIAFMLSKAFSFISKGIGLFGGLFIATSFTQVFHLFIIAITIIILQLTAFYPRKILLNPIYKRSSNNTFSKTDVINKMGEQFRIIEYPLIILFVITGAIFLISTNDLVSLFLSIELQSYGLYLLCTIYRNSELSTSAGLTYFLLGGLASCFILLGTGLLYANSGTTSLDGFYILTSISSIADDAYISLLSKPFYINVSLLIMSVGFLFKISAAPFHF